MKYVYEGEYLLCVFEESGKGFRSVYLSDEYEKVKEVQDENNFDDSLQTIIVKVVDE